MKKQIVTALTALVMAIPVWAAEDVSTVVPSDKNVQTEEMYNAEMQGDVDANLVWTCMARSSRGYRYYGRSFWRSIARDQALRQCYRRSGYCRIVQCWWY